MPGLHQVYIDLPGMGSTLANNIKDLDEVYLRLVEFIGLRLGRSRILLVGSSRGGYLARALAQQFIDRVDGLLLRVPLIEPRDNIRDLDAFEPLVTDEEVMSNVSAKDRTLLGNILIQTPAYIEMLKAKHYEFYLPAERRSVTEMLDPIRADPDRYRLSHVLVGKGTKFFAPTLVVCGRQNDSVGYRDSLRLLELYPRSTHVVLGRATHSFPVDQTGLFEALVNDWVNRVREIELVRTDKQ